MDFLYDDEQDALREAVKGLVGKAYGDYENRRQARLARGRRPRLRREAVDEDGRDGPARAAVLRGGRRRRRRPGRDRHRLPGARPGDRSRALPHVGGAGRRAGLRLRHRRAAAGAPRRAVRRRERAGLRARRAGPRLDSDGRAGHRGPGRRRPGRSPASRSRCRTAPVPTCSSSARRCRTAAPGCSSSSGGRLASGPATRRTTARGPPGSPSTARRRLRWASRAPT